MFIGRTDAEAEAPKIWPHDVMSRFIGKDPDVEKDRRQQEKWGTENEMVGWHHGLNEHEFQQTSGDSEGQKRLVCFSPQGNRVRQDLETKQQQIIITTSNME